jgi:hypothetical protein
VVAVFMWLNSDTQIACNSCQLTQFLRLSSFSSCLCGLRESWIDREVVYAATSSRSAGAGAVVRVQQSSAAALSRLGTS